jgi:hypothetical protein
MYPASQGRPQATIIIFSGSRVMQRITFLKALAVGWAGALLASCSDQPVSPTAAASRAAPHAARLQVAEVATPLPDAFTVRAPIDPYFINQSPDLMLRSRLRADLAIQRLVTVPSEGLWHVHPGPSFAIVERGRVMITRFSKKNGCVATVYGPAEPAGNTYYEEAGEVHRASVVGTETAVEYKVRFNTPIGAPFAENVGDPGC